PSAPVSFTVEDVESPASSLLVTATSANTNLIPNQNIQLSGTGTNRTVAVTPAANQFGNALITIIATDPDGGSGSESVRGGANRVNDAPTLNQFSDLTLMLTSGAQTVALTGNTAGPPNEHQAFVVTATSSNPGLVDDPGVSYSSPSTTGTLNFTPVP